MSRVKFGRNLPLNIVKRHAHPIRKEVLQNEIALTNVKRKDLLKICLIRLLLVIFPDVMTLIAAYVKRIQRTPCSYPIIVWNSCRIRSLLRHKIFFSSVLSSFSLGAVVTGQIPKHPPPTLFRSEPVAHRAFVQLPGSQSIRRTPSHLRSIDAWDHTNANPRCLLFREESFCTHTNARMHTPPCPLPPATISPLIRQCTSKIMRRNFYSQFSDSKLGLTSLSG